MRDAAGNYDDEIKIKRGSRPKGHRKAPTRVKRHNRPAFDQKFVRKLDKNKTPVYGGGAPKKLTKGLKRQLRKVWKGNPAEAQRQLTWLGIEGPDTHLKKLLGFPDPPAEGKRR